MISLVIEGARKIFAFSNIEAHGMQTDAHMHTHTHITHTLNKQWYYSHDLRIALDR